MFFFFLCFHKMDRQVVLDLGEKHSDKSMMSSLKDLPFNVETEPTGIAHCM